MTIVRMSQSYNIEFTSHKELLSFLQNYIQVVQKGDDYSTRKITVIIDQGLVAC